MVREATWRVRKYKGKIDPDAIRIRFDRLKDDMGVQQEVKQAELAELQAKVRDILNEHGINPVFTMPYMACANELYGLVQKFAGKAFEDEVVITLNKWKARGLVEAVLTDIAALFGVTYPPAGP